MYIKKVLTTPCFQPHNIDRCTNLCDVATKSRDGLLFAYLIQMCLPPEIIEEHIASHLAKCVATKYKHRLISYKCHAKQFESKWVSNNKWTHVIKHDGTYHILPETEDEAIMWDNTDLKRRHTFEPQDDVSYTVSRMFAPNKEKLDYAVSVPSNEEEETGKLLLTKLKENVINISTIIKTTSKITHCLLSNDCSLLAVGTSKEGYNFSIYNIASSSFDYAFLMGSISALCAAHHYPMFAVGGNQAATSKLPNVAFVRWGKENIHLSYDAPITCLEFSPDDTRLLTCSYDAENNLSKLILWDTSNLDKLTCINGISWKSQINKAFFIGDGERIVTVEKDGAMHFFDGYTGKQVKTKKVIWLNSCDDINREDTPLWIWNNHDNLLISVFDDTIRFLKISSGAYIGGISSPDTVFIGMGLAASKKAIILMNKKEEISQLKLYDEEESNNIAFITKEANLIQLYEILQMCRKHKNSVEHIKNFIPLIKSYIQEQQKQINAK